MLAQSLLRHSCRQKYLFLDKSRRFVRLSYPTSIHQAIRQLNTKTSRVTSNETGVRRYTPHLAAVGIYYNSQRYVSSRKAMELTKRKENTETDPERYEHHVSNLIHDIRRNERINKADMAAVLELLEKGTSIKDHSTFLLDCCCDLLPDMKPMERVAVAQKIWESVQDERKESLDSFNALLQCYTYNDYFEFDPLSAIENITKYVSRIDGSEIKPSQLTYYLALLSYCKRGDLTNAVTVLNKVKDKDFPVDEKFFNALILGNARSGDLSTAKEMLKIMKSTHVEPSSRTYTCLMQAYIEADKLTELEKLYVAAKKEVKFCDDDMLHLATVAVLKEDERALDKVLDWGGSIGSAIELLDVNKSVTSLVHRGYPEQAFRIYLTFADRMPIPPNTTGRFFIKELIYSNTDLSIVLSVCGALKENGFNANALTTAAEYSLRGKRPDLSFSLFQKMKEENILVRPHYFWPAIINLFEYEGVRGIIKVLQKMQTLEVTPDWETKYEYLVPRLFTAMKDPVEVAKVLKDSGGLSLSSGIFKAILMYLLKQNRLEDASKFCTTLRGKLTQPNTIVDLLLHSVLDFDARETISGNVELSVPILKAISENVPHEDKTDYVGKFVIRFIEAMGIAMPHLVKALTKGIENAKIPMSEVTVEMLTSQGHLECAITINSELVLNDGLASRIFLHPREMDVQGLESHAEELKTKQLNARGTLRKLFIKYCQDKEFTKALRLKEEFETEYGSLSIGMQSALMGLFIHRRQVQQALDLFKKLKLASIEPDAGEGWRLDCYKIFDLVTLMVEKEMADQAYLLLEESLELPNLNLPEHLKSVNRNVIRMLESFSKYESSSLVNDYVSEVIDLLLKKNLVEPCNPVLGCVVKHYALKKDLATALELFTEYAEKYKLTPGRLQLAYALLNDEDLLSKYTAVCVSIWGEVNTKHSLAYAMADTGDIHGASKLFNELGTQIQFINILKQCEFLGERREIGKILNLINALTNADRKMDTSKLYLIALRSCQRSNSIQDLKLVLAALQEQSGFIPSHVHRYADEVKNGHGKVSSEPLRWQF